MTAAHLFRICSRRADCPARVDEAGHAIVEKRQEGKYLGWEESITIMETMDEVRKQGGIKYPQKIETTDYPVAL